MKTAVMPAEKLRLKVFKEMTKATQEVAKDLETRLEKQAAGTVMISYQMGKQLADVLENEAEYGSKAAEQLATYLAIAGGETTIYNLSNFAKAFDKEFVQDQSTKVMPNGKYLEVGHWFKLMQISDRKDQEKMLTKILKESWSVNQLESEIRSGTVKTKNARAGGRKPSTPTSPIAGLQQTFAIAQKFANMEKVLDKSVFDAIDEMPPDAINEALLGKLEETQTTLDRMMKAGEVASKRVVKNIERVKKVLANKAKHAGDESAEPVASGKKKKKKLKLKDGEELNGKGEVLVSIKRNKSKDKAQKKGSKFKKKKKLKLQH